MVAILMISGKLATVRLLKVKMFSDKDYDFIIHVHGVVNKVLSCESNYFADVVM